MSQNSRNKTGDAGNSGRGMNDSHERKQYEGFEGMNYEQVRQPFPSKKMNNNSAGEHGNNGKDGHHDE